MDNIKIPDFYIKKDFIYLLFDKYMKKENYGNNFTEDIMNYIFKKLNINLETFKTLFKKYIDPEYKYFGWPENRKICNYDYDLIIKNNLSIILSLFIYINGIKKNINKNDININNIKLLIDYLHKYKNLLNIIQELIIYSKNNKSIDIYMENFNLNLNFKSKCLEDKVLFLTYKCIEEFINIFWNEHKDELKDF